MAKVVVASSIVRPPPTNYRLSYSIHRTCYDQVKSYRYGTVLMISETVLFSCRILAMSVVVFLKLLFLNPRKPTLKR